MTEVIVLHMHEPTFFLDDVEAQAAGERLRVNWCDERAISEAEWASVFFRDRLVRGHVAITTIGGQHFQGTVTSVYSDAVVLNESVLISVAAIAMCEHLNPEFPVETSASQLSGRSELRSWIGAVVTGVLAGERRITGRVRHVGGDHAELEMNGECIVVMHAAVNVWLRRN